MTQIFFDESYHERGGFTLGAFVLCECDPASTITSAIVEVGLTPGINEYKSRERHTADCRFQELRSKLYRLARECRIGLMVAPYKERDRLGEHVLRALAHIIQQNEIAHPITASLDEGLFRSKKQFEVFRVRAELPNEVQLQVECDSRVVPGIQLADLVAHTCSIALLGTMGISDKTVRDEEEGEYQLSFEMWARLRYSFLVRELTEPGLEDAAAAGMLDGRCGLYIAPECDSLVSEMALARFGHTWLGCIH